MRGVFTRVRSRLRRLGGATVTAMMMSASLVVVADAATGEKRVALVIGNGAYQSVPALQNPLTDSKAVAAALKRIGFDVVEGYDMRLDAMRAAVGEYAAKLDGAKVAFVYYAGHGVAVAGENYLLPTDTVLKNESDLDFRTMNINLVMRQMQREDRVNVVVLDACRDNPFAKELARSMKTRSTSVAAGLSEIAVGSAAGTMIAFATDPGKTALDGIAGGNSPFTTALLKHMETPNVSISTVMDRVREDVWRSTGEKQRPWVNTSIIGEFYLNPAARPAAQIASADATTLAPAVMAAAPTPQSLEIRLWESAERSGSPEDYKAYLEAHPNGYFAQIARNRIARSVTPAAGSAPAAAAPATDSAELKTETGSAASETALNLSAKERSEAQARLKALGFDPGGTTGKFGPGTRRALTNWQKTHDIPASGFLTRAQKDALWTESEPEYGKLAAAAAPAAAIAAPVVARTVRPAAIPRPQQPRVVAVPVVRRPAPQAAPAQRGPSLGEVGSFLGGVGSLVNSVRR